MMAMAMAMIRIRQSIRCTSLRFGARSKWAARFSADSGAKINWKKLEKTIDYCWECMVMYAYINRGALDIQ